MENGTVSTAVSTTVLSSIISPDCLAQLMQKYYQFSLNIQCSILRTGINHAYLICDGDRKSVLRVYSHQWRGREEINEELQLLLRLKEAGISISYPISDKAGKFIHEVTAPEGRRYAVLFSFAEGKKLRKLTEKHCRKIGQTMGRMHQLTADQSVNRVSYDFDTLLALPFQHALRFFDKQNPDMVFLYNAMEQARQQLSSFGGQLRTGIVHLDMWYDNMNITERGKITVFDFDFCGNGWLSLDIAYTVMQLYHTEPDKKVLEGKLAAFFAGYEETEKIPEIEKELISYLGICVWTFYLGVQSRRFNDWSNIFLSENYLTHYIGLLKGWLKYQETEVG